MTGPRRDVRAASIRVALGATALVAVMYLVVAVGVFVIVTNTLTSQLDARLARDLERTLAGPATGTPPPDAGFEPPEPDRPFGPPVLVWTVLPDGTVVSSTSGADLPADAVDVTTPETITVGGEEVRVTGGTSGDNHVIVGQRTAEVTATQQVVLLAEVIIGLVLLVLVFVGAVAVGRRVAAPIERARQRQLAFSADASHELRTPVSVIEAQTSLSLSGQREPEADRRAFERIDRESRRIRRILEDLLWLARFDAWRGAPDAEPVDVGVMASATADRFGVVAEARGLTIAVTTAPGDHVVAIPPEWLDRLLGVLVDNACKFAPDGSTVRIAVGGEAGRVALAVEDAGPGIPVAQRDRIFDRFHRATDGGSGAGLGLAIADGIVRATHGRWRVGESDLGGASMGVSWPRALGEPGEGTARAS
jgi:signal transduction histidine kinase